MTQIGRKIYYELATGNIILETGERQGDVVETTFDQDIATFTALSERNRSSFDVLELSFGAYADNFVKYPYHVDPTTKSVIWDTVPLGGSLQDLQTAKIAQLTDFETKANESFQSSALGTPHTYLSNSDAMGKFNAEYSFVNSAAYDGLPILWFTLEEGGVVHTKDEFNQVWLDGRNFIAANFSKWDSLVKQVKACTTVDEVNAIAW